MGNKVLLRYLVSSRKAAIVATKAAPVRCQQRRFVFLLVYGASFSFQALVSFPRVGSEWLLLVAVDFLVLVLLPHLPSDFSRGTGFDANQKLIVK